MLIRRATEPDISQLCLLYREFHLYHVLAFPDWLRVPDDASLDAWETNTVQQELLNIIRREDAALFVVEIEGKVVGLAEAYLRQDEEQPLTIAHRYGYLQSLLVSTPYRKRGLGDALMKAVHHWAKEKGATEIQLDSWEFPEGPVQFYERLRYRTLRRHMVIDLL
jgi:GNAT superfamily N-acetyltransferase